MVDNDVDEEEDIEAGNNLTADILVATPIPKAANPGGSKRSKSLEAKRKSFSDTASRFTQPFQ